MQQTFQSPEEFVRWLLDNYEIAELDELDPVLTDIQKAERKARLRDEKLSVLILREKAKV